MLFFTGDAQVHLALVMKICHILFYEDKLDSFYFSPEHPLEDFLEVQLQ